MKRVLIVLVCSISTLPVASVVLGGTYSGISGVTVGAPDNPIARASITKFESSVVNYSPAPGVGPNFKSPTTGVGSLGELYSPVLKPGGAANTPFDLHYQPQAGTKPSSLHAGSANSTATFNGNVNDSTDTYGFIGIDQPGSITLGFNTTITNGAGPDIAVFENGFGFGTPASSSLLAELAFVEVSTNGTDFIRFPSISTNTAPTAVSGAFQGYDMSNVFNLAGKHAANWGTPFDLSDLIANPLVLNGTVDLSAIHFVRLVDVVGSGVINDANGNPIPGIARDSLGNPILDNYVTYDSAGFDYVGLPTGAVGVINAVPEPSTIVLAACAGFAALTLRKRRAR